MMFVLRVLQLTYRIYKYLYIIYFIWGKLKNYPRSCYVMTIVRIIFYLTSYIIYARKSESKGKFEINTDFADTLI